MDVLSFLALQTFLSATIFLQVNAISNFSPENKQLLLILEQKFQLFWLLKVKFGHKKVESGSYSSTTHTHTTKNGVYSMFKKFTL